MNKTSVLVIIAAAGLVASPILAQQTSSEATSEASQPSSVTSSQLSSEPVSEASSELSQANSPQGGGVSFSLDVDVSFRFQLTFEQAVEFKRLVKEANSAPVEASSSFDITVGTTVPSTVTLTLLPATISALYPQLDGFLFFVLPDGRIVVVNPTTLKIVLILTVD